MSSTNSFAGSLFMVVAPSGAGKSTLVNALLAQEPTIKLSISTTTRAPRPGETHGKEYYFTTAEDFVQRADAGEFLEWAEVHGNYYGTSRIMVEQQMKTGTDILLEIDWQGARQVKKQFPQAAGIFILPPSIDALEERLKKRATDAPHVITRRLLAAGGEIAHAPEFEYAIINEEFAVALSELTAIVRAARCRFAQQAARNASLFAQLGIHAE
ncbi:MAG: guanylate kinase [Pseudomonadota bacterium]|uniref:Guanylate kinase n=1 Tax=Duganella vulcania TaxID=2692166 RepID=A0A845HSS7_9BURK|nr:MULTISPECIES: guanylate kinase [Duganella]MYM98350.1 guanylate kinase [Duganella vulcania]MYN19436.1 guanylate kinase [Duganella vulcania]RFP25860.1 guanylate kinase [Duganella sp. BJB489]RFP28399.1 guanylate kinase [Duganella sp. BJB488]RFP36790.1 guanylate kinase [Duganella sp. BJB480]